MEIVHELNNKTYKLLIDQLSGRLSINLENSTYYGQWLPLFNKLVMFSKLDKQIISKLECVIKNDPRKDNIRLSI